MMDPVSFEVTDAPEKVDLNEPFEVTIEANIEGEWHLYSAHNDPDKGPFPTEFSPKTEGVSFTDSVRESEPSINYDPNFETELGWHSNSATFTLPLKVQKASSSPKLVEVDVRYQVCDDKACLPPKTKTLAFKTEVEGAGSGSSASAEGTANEGQISQGTSSAGYGGGKSVFSFLWIAITAGLAALLTPCVFPMIPLTVSYFSKQTQGSYGQVVGKALIFGVAIVGTFTILGVVLSLLLGASGANKFASNPWVNLFIGAVLVLFAVSLLGLFEIRLPYKWTNYLNEKSTKSSGAWGILFMGLTISAVSFSCTAPFVGGVLAATTGGEWFYPIIGMMGFSAAFSLPFVLFAVFPRWLESLPQSGSWMNIVKVLLGFIELAAAFKFISNADLVWQWGLVSRPFTIAAWIVIFLIAGFYLLGMIGIGYDSKPKAISTPRMLLAIPFLTFSFYLIPGLLGSSLGIWDAWLPPKQATDASVVNSIQQGIRTGGGGSSTQFAAGESQNNGWSHDYEEALSKAKEQNRPLFIDFTGYTCTNCRAMETNVFPRESVQTSFKEMQKVRLYTDDGTDGPENQQFQYELTGTVALPTYVILDPHSEQIVRQQVGYTELEKFATFLETGLEAYNSRASLE